MLDSVIRPMDCWFGGLVNLSRISNQSYLGKLVRAPLRLIPKSAVFPILQGPLRGKKWVVGSSAHGCWLGSYEFEKQRAFQLAIKRGDVVYDVGANVGFYTLLSSVLTGDQGRVYAFEPVPDNLRELRNHLAINHVSNCIVIEAAVAAEDGAASFERALERTEGRLSAYGDIVVRTVALDSLLMRGSISPPSLMKIDIEGAEVECLRGAEQTIRSSHPTIFLATHGSDLNVECLKILAGWGYGFRPLDARATAEAREFIAEPLTGLLKR
jgi:FkbM family methyltransferase